MFVLNLPTIIVSGVLGFGFLMFGAITLQKAEDRFGQQRLGGWFVALGIAAVLLTVVMFVVYEAPVPPPAPPPGPRPTTQMP